MHSSPSRVTAQSGYFVIADLSGYTRFVTENDLEHAQGVLHDLVTLIIDKLGAPLEFVELEGDAVFVYARENAVSDAERLLDMMEACYAAFRLRIESMVRNTTCQCTACRSMPQLDLKCVGHFGRFAVQATPKGEQLVGPDVTLVHRMLKNRLIETTGIRAYALLTEAFMDRAGVGAGSAGRDGESAGLGLQPHVEEVESFGTVKARVLDLAACVERHRERFRQNLDALPVDLEIVTPMPAPAHRVWGYVTEPALRVRWQRLLAVSNEPAANGRTDIGWESHCDHGGYRMVHRIVDWRPFDRITFHTTAKGTSIAAPPPCQADYIFEPLPDGTCQLRFQVRLRDVGFLTRTLFKAVKPMARREWAGYFAQLREILAQDQASDMALAGSGKPLHTLSTPSV